MTAVICIGAGPAGLTAAYALGKQGREVIVLEADPHYVGGISRTIQRDGLCFDIGGHRFFSKSAEVVALWKEILGDDLLTRKRKSRIYYNHHFYPYPIDLRATLRNLGLWESFLCGVSYLKARLWPHRDPKTFEQWVSNQFGARLFRIFFKTYTEKVWGMRCDEIAAEWAAQRIKGLSLASAVANALGFKRKTVIKTLIESFLYPRKGPGMMWEAAARKIEAMGGQVRMGAKVEKLRYDAAARLWHVSYSDAAGPATLAGEHVISSMPLKELVFAVDGAPQAVREAAARLRYRDFITVALVLENHDGFDDNWIYIHDPDVKVGRIQNFKAWSPEMVPDPALLCYGMEYFCFEGDGLWNSSDQALIAQATRELAAIKLAKESQVKRGYVVRQSKTYPIYDQAYEGHVRVIREWLARDCPGLHVVGRNGMHKYNNQDHSMMTAMLTVRNILAQKPLFDVWQVNQDAEYHEEERSGASGERLVPTSV